MQYIDSSKIRTRQINTSYFTSKNSGKESLNRKIIVFSKT